jgi:hypothetical protein
MLYLNVINYELLTNTTPQTCMIPYFISMRNRKQSRGSHKFLSLPPARAPSCRRPCHLAPLSFLSSAPTDVKKKGSYLPHM